MHPICPVSAVQAEGGGVIVRGMFSWHKMDLLISIYHQLNATAYLSIVADHVHAVMAMTMSLMSSTCKTKQN